MLKDIEKEIEKISKKAKTINVFLKKDEDGLFKGCLPFKIEGDYILNSSNINNEHVVVECDNGVITIDLEAKESSINAFLTKDEASIFRALVNNLKTDALKEKPFFVIGPPGTGKTSVILEIIKYNLKKGLKILVASPTNKAVENIFERLNIKELPVKESEIVLTIKTEVERLKKYSPKAIKEKKIQALKDGLEVIKMAKEETMKKIRKLQPETEVFTSKHKAADTKIANIKKEIASLKDKKETLQDTLDSINFRVSTLNANSFVMSVAKMFAKEKIEELESEKKRLERKIKTLNDLIAKELKELQEIEENKKRDNSSLNSILKELEELDNSLKKLNKEIKKIVVELQKVKEVNQIEQSKLVGATLVNASLNSVIQDGSFDVLIIDEASMALMPFVLAASQAINNKKISSSNENLQIDERLNTAQKDAVKKSLNSKLIVIGDPKQLPPIANTYELRKDIFSLYCADTIFAGGKIENCVFLDVNYRNHPDITQVASNMFYGGLLKSGKEKDNKSSIYIKKSRSKMIPQNGSFINRANAKIAVEQIQKALEAGRRDIGVITPYNKQAKLIDSLLTPLKEKYEDADIDVGTVHTFQGKEKEIIIYDLTFSPSEKSDFIPAAFQGDKDSQTAKLLNVAMTRAKEFFILIGDVDGFAKIQGDYIIKDWVKQIIKIAKGMEK